MKAHLAPIAPDGSTNVREWRAVGASVTPSSPVTIIAPQLLKDLGYVKGTDVVMDGRKYPTAIVAVRVEPDTMPQTLVVVLSAVQARRAAPARMIIGNDYLSRVQRRFAERQPQRRNHRHRSTSDE